MLKMYIMKLFIWYIDYKKHLLHNAVEWDFQNIKNQYSLNLASQSVLGSEQNGIVTMPVAGNQN